ncbi:MAG: DUF2064 domain-containing protein [Bacteroidia bacterium]|nr:DUF2064 domain-containing protein [Bacteroidia bacterium]
MPDSATSAVLLFALDPAQDAKAAVFGGRRGAFVRAFGQMERRTQAHIRRAGLRLIHAGSSQQPGTGFGDRLARAVSEAFGAGAEYLIVVGNDCPGLRAQDLLQAQAALEAGCNVLGPAADGGDYLIGLRRADFDAEALRQVCWNTAAVHAELMALLSNAQGPPRVLRTLADLDDPGAVRRWAARMPGSVLREVLLSLLAPAAPAEPAPAGLARQLAGVGAHCPWRGPPQR